MDLRVILVLFSLALSPGVAKGQVRLFQWSDVHSQLATIAMNAATMDQLAQEFLRENPKGEVAIVVNGDFTSITPESRFEKGDLAFAVLKYFIKERGYTVLFVPGNHDAFDWTEEIDGIKLFKEQMRKLKKWGGHILAANLYGLRKSMADTLSPHYDFKGTKVPARFYGITLRKLLEKSNLTDINSRRLFRGIHSYKSTWKRILARAGKDQVKHLVLGIHDTYPTLKKQLSEIDEIRKEMKQDGKKPPAISVMMAGHDHVAASDVIGKTLLSDAVSHGAFSVMDLNKQGEYVKGSLQHWAVHADGASRVSGALFNEGQVYNQSTLERESDLHPRLAELADEIKVYVEKMARELNRVLVNSRGFVEHKMDLKEGRKPLGSLLGEALVAWIKSEPGLNDLPALAMVNSSAYRMEQSIPAGPISEATIRGMYPYLTHATVYELTGEQVKKLFYSLRRYYPAHGEDFYTPQMNFGFREMGLDLEVWQDGRWQALEDKERYLVAFDGWLSQHRFGESYRIKQWKLLEKVEPAAQAVYQEVLVEFLPDAIRRFERKQRTRSTQARCQGVFSRPSP